MENYRISMENNGIKSRKENQLLWLKEGNIVSFNDNRKKTHEPLDLKGEILSIAYLPKADLSKVFLRGSRLIRTMLFDVHLEEADLRGSNLSMALIIKGHLKGANLSDAICSKTVLSGAELQGADLSRADLSDSYLPEVDLSKAKLPGAILISTELTLVDATEADFSDAIIVGCTNFSGLKCDKADFNNSIIDNKRLIDYLVENGAKHVPNAKTNKAELREAVRKNLQEIHPDSDLNEEEILKSSIIGSDKEAYLQAITQKKIQEDKFQ